MAGRKGMKSGKGTTLPKRLRPGGLRSLDGRSAVYRELHTDYLSVADQLGGEEQLSPVQRWLAESLVFSNAWRRRLEHEAIKTKALDVQRYVALVDRVHGITKTLGLRRVPKPAQTMEGALAALREKAADGGSNE
jgi:hypothetical protein